MLFENLLAQQFFKVLFFWFLTFDIILGEENRQEAVIWTLTISSFVYVKFK